MTLIKDVKKFINRSLGRSKHTQTVMIGDIPVGKGHPVYVISEIGINHNGDMDIAKKLIDVSAEAGCQAVKFQKRTIDVVYSAEKLAKPREMPREMLETAVKRGVLAPEAVKRLEESDYKDSTNSDQKYALEFTMDEYKELAEYSREKGLHLFASPWDLGSVDDMEQVDPPCYKIASASLTDHELLLKVKATGKPIILSTGMSTLPEVHEAVKVLGLDNLILLHTVSTYPAEDKHINLSLIPGLRMKFPTVPIGYSGHESGVAISVAAATMGAHVLERHVTLDKTMYGSDQKASIEPHELKDLVNGIREMETAYGDGVKQMVPEEEAVRDKLRRV